MKTTSLGRLAESVVAEALVSRGFTIIERNWRTKICEIDLIASRGDVVYFIEVKHRSRSQQGAGLDYITEAKLRQMTFAAELWVSRHGWSGDWRLAAAQVAAGPAGPLFEDFVEL